MFSYLISLLFEIKPQILNMALKTLSNQHSSCLFRLISYHIPHFLWAGHLPSVCSSYKGLSNMLLILPGRPSLSFYLIISFTLDFNLVKTSSRKPFMTSLIMPVFPFTIMKSAFSCRYGCSQGQYFIFYFFYFLNFN